MLSGTPNSEKILHVNIMILFSSYAKLLRTEKFEKSFSAVNYLQHSQLQPDKLLEHEIRFIF